MDEKEEREWLKERYVRDRSFHVGMGRAILLGFFIMLVDNFLHILSWETPEQRGFAIISYLIIMLTGILSAHWGKFKYNYETDLERYFG